MADNEVDVRELRKPDKHPTIFAAFDALAVDDSFVLVNNHDPRHLRDEFELDHAGTYGWDYLQSGPRVWRIRISRLAPTQAPASPRVPEGAPLLPLLSSPDDAGAADDH